MDELLEEERRESLIEKIALTIRECVLTNRDALEIIGVLDRALRRQENTLYEEMLVRMLKTTGE